MGILKKYDYDIYVYQIFTDIAMIYGKILEEQIKLME